MLSPLLRRASTHGLCACLLACGLALLLAGCSGGRNQASLDQVPVSSPEPTAPAPINLPSPAELARKGSKLPLDNQRVHDGSEYDPVYSRNVTAMVQTVDVHDWNSASNAVFDPGFNKPGDSVGDLAYAMYNFYGFVNETGTMKVHVDWTGTQLPENCYVGLANLSSNRWDWFKLPPSETFTVGTIERYIEDAAVLARIRVVILVTGSETCELEHLLLGEALPLLCGIGADLDQDVTANLAPRTINFGVYGNFAGSDFAGVDFDLDGQAGYEISADADGVISQDFNEPGEFTVRARVHDSLGRTLEIDRSFVLIDPNNQVPVAALSRDVASGTAPLDVTWDASGSMDADGTITKYRWDVDADGEWDFTTSEPTLHYRYGHKGQLFCVVETTDNYFATDTASNFVTTSNGWQTKTLDTPADGIETVDITQTYGGGPSKACIVYSSYYPGSLHAIASNDSGGVTWGAPQTLIAEGDHQSAISPSICTLAGGIPMLAYGEEVSAADSSYTLKVMSATSSAATSWNSPILVSAGDDAGRDNCIEVIDGVPAIASCDKSIQAGHVYYYRAQNAAGTVWSAGQLIGELGIEDFDSPALFDGSSGPLLAIGVSGNGLPEFSLQVLGATDNGGTEWINPKSWSGVVAYSQSFTSTDAGNPVLGAGGTGQASKLYTVNGNTDGTGWADELTDLSLPAPRSGGACSLGFWNNHPVMAFESWDGGDLYFVEAVDGIASAWQEPYSVWTIGNTGMSPSLTVVSGLYPVIAFASSAGASDDLNVAYWTP